MKIIDLLRMSSSNLFRRKLRTMLTILGVIIGTASIVVMVSLGLGLNKSTMDEIENNGGLTTIHVYANESGGYMDGGMDGGKEKEIKRLNDDVVMMIREMPNVSIVSPIFQLSVLARQGAYESYLNLQGMSIEALEKLDIPLAEGTLPKKGNQELELVFGNQVLSDFYNPKTGSYPMYETGELPPVDLMNKPLFVIFDTDAYYQSQSPGEDGVVVQPPKKYLINGCGLVEGDSETYNNYSWNVYCDVEALKTQVKKVFKNKAVPGQPTTKAGKPYKELFYNSIYVKVDNMSHVKEIQAAINEMGYQAESNIEWLESMQKQYTSIQAVLGGIGAVSLFVAAIGIANTMMMSIYERTKEIGVIKVLGCALSNIRTMFLMEAAFIGFIGGFAGIVLSYIISGIINHFALSMMASQTAASYIPTWLAAAALGFAVLVGMLAGFFPALRAMKLSPLAAIRTE